MKPTLKLLCKPEKNVEEYILQIGSKRKEYSVNYSPDDCGWYVIRVSDWRYSKVYPYKADLLNAIVNDTIDWSNYGK